MVRMLSLWAPGFSIATEGESIVGFPSRIAQAFENACDGSPSGVSIADLDEVVVKLVQQAIDGDAKPEDILNDGLVAGMDIMGRKFKEQLLFVPEVLFAARAMKGGVELLKPLLAETGIEPAGTMIIGAPVTQSFADEISAQGYAPDAASAIDKAKILAG